MVGSQRGTGRGVRRGGLTGAARAAVEMMEHRRLMSGGSSFVAGATPLGAFAPKAHAARAGVVGPTSSDALYQVSVTAPLDLQVNVTALR